MIDRSINVAVGQKGRNVMPKATIPFGLGGLRILLARLGNQRRIYGRVKPLGGTRHDENVVAIVAEMIAVLLEQQPCATVAGGNANPHAATSYQRRQHRTKGFQIRRRTIFGTPITNLVANYGEQRHAARHPETVGDDADADVTAKHDLVAAPMLSTWPANNGDANRKPRT